MPWGGGRGAEVEMSTQGLGFCLMAMAAPDSRDRVAATQRGSPGWPERDQEAGVPGSCPGCASKEVSRRFQTPRLGPVHAEPPAAAQAHGARVTPHTRPAESPPLPRPGKWTQASRLWGDSSWRMQKELKPPTPFRATHTGRLLRPNRPHGPFFVFISFFLFCVCL